MMTELSDLIDELKRFEEEIISEICPAIADTLNCDKFCGGDDCIIVRTVNALKKGGVGMGTCKVIWQQSER